MNIDEMDKDQLKDFARANDLGDLVDLRAKTETLRADIKAAMELKSEEAEEEPESLITGPAPEPAVAESTIMDGPNGRLDDMMNPPAPAPEPEPEVVKPDEFVVERHSRWFQAGICHTLHAGSIVSANTHPIDELRAQGVPLKPISSRPSQEPVLGHRFA